MAIFGTIETVKAQINNPSFEKAFLYIDKLQDKNSDEYKSLLNIGLDDCNKIVLDEHCFVLEQAYISKNKEDCFFESHKKYIDIQYITIILIIRSYGCTKIPPLFFKGCCNGLHDSFGSRSIFSRLFFDYLNLNHYFCINT